MTPLGQLFAALVSLFGILLFAVPAAIVSAGFVEEGMKAGDIGASAGPEQQHTGREIASQLKAQARLIESMQKQLAAQTVALQAIQAQLGAHGAASERRTQR